MAFNDFFSWDSQDFRKLRRLFKRAPKQMRYAHAGLLNTLAFGLKKQIPRSLAALLTIRNERYVSNKIRVQMAKGGQTIDMQVSRAGSIYAKNFTGWEEQEGVRSKRSRVVTLDSRGGKFSNVVQGKSRLKPSNEFGGKQGGQNFTDPDSIKGAKDDNHRLFIFLKMQERNRKQQSFMIKRKTGKFGPGLYRFKRNKVRKQQDFKPKKVQPKRKPWMSHAIKQYMGSIDLKRLLAKEIKHIFKLK